MTAQLYGQFLVSSQVNYTGTYLAEHLEGLPHDNVPYFLKTQRFTPRQLWQQVRPQLVLSQRGYVLFDDTVLDKQPVRAWTRLKQAAYHTKQAVYQLKQGFLDEYMRHELMQPSLAFA